MKLSGFFIVTEPEKMGFPYYESILAAAQICDEIIVISGREEAISKKKLSLIDNVTIIETDSWPRDWHYDDMMYHLQAGLDNCTGDFALKIDADNVFRTENKDAIRKKIESFSLFHHVTIGRINFKCSDTFLPNKASEVIYAINKTLCKSENISVKISNSSGSNLPVFDKKIKKTRITNENFWPINYDNTFMSKIQITDKWIRWYRAVDRFKKNDLRFSLDDHEKAWNNFVTYQKVKQRQAYTIKDFHPAIMHDKIKSLKKYQWGYDNTCDNSV